MIWYIYIVSIAYCIYKMGTSYSKTSLDGVIGPTPNMETIMILLFAPVYAVVDIFFTVRRKYIEHKES